MVYRGGGELDRYAVLIMARTMALGLVGNETVAIYDGRLFALLIADRIRVGRLVARTFFQATAVR